MWRSFFIALGIMAIIVGLESLVIHSANFYSSRGSTAGEFIDPSTVSGQSIITWQPKEWFPWLVLSVGSLIVIYSFTLPQRFRSSAG
ncbi:MAG: hypothetical protein AAFN70_16235 [Planctomycetota bacterium]